MLQPLSFLKLTPTFSRQLPSIEAIIDAIGYENRRRLE